MDGPQSKLSGSRNGASERANRAAAAAAAAARSAECVCRVRERNSFHKGGKTKGVSKYFLSPLLLCDEEVSRFIRPCAKNG